MVVEYVELPSLSETELRDAPHWLQSNATCQESGVDDEESSIEERDDMAFINGRYTDVRWIPLQSALVEKEGLTTGVLKVLRKVVAGMQAPPPSKQKPLTAFFSKKS